MVTHQMKNSGAAHACPRSVPGACSALAAALLLCFVMAADAAAQRQSADSAQVAADSAGAVGLAPIVVTVSKLSIAPARSGFSVSIVQPAVLRADRPAYAADVLRTLPGSYIDEAVGPGGPAIVRLRGGEEVFTQILMDGVQLNENGGFFDFQGVTLGNIERVEVARGPQSALYGSSAVSGVVQFITRSGSPGPTRFGGLLEGGGDATDGRSFRASGNARGGSERVLYSAGGGVAYNRGIFGLPHDTWTRDASLRIDATSSARWSFGAVARYIGVESNHPVRDAGATRVPLDPNARLHRNRFLTTANATFQASPRWTNALRAAVFRHDFLFLDRQDGISQPADFFVTDASFDFNSDLTRTTLEYVGQLASSSRPLEARARIAWGAQWEHESLASDLTGDFGDQTIDLGRASIAAFTDLVATPSPRLSLLGGARAEHYDGLGTEWTPRASAVFAVVPGRIRLRAAAGRAYKVPNLQEQYLDNAFIAPNPDLEPETSVSWEAGVDIVASPRVSAHVTAFRQNFTNLIRTVAAEGESRASNRNVGRSRASGVEASIAYEISANLTAGLDATRTWTRINDNEGLPPDQYPLSGTLPFRPAHVATAWLLATQRRLQISGRATWIGTQTVLSERFSGQRVDIDGYLRADATANLSLAAGRSIFLRIINLFDAAYDTAFDMPGQPFTAALGFQFGSAP